MAYVDHISVDGVQYDIRDAESVSFEQEQTLTDVQQEQARANIGAGSETDVADLKSHMGNVENAVEELEAGSLSALNALENQVPTAHGDGTWSWEDSSEGEKLISLSEIDGAANTVVLNTLLLSDDVKLKRGTYPLEGTVAIDNHTLDLNGSKIMFPVYTSGTSMFVLSGYSPCIKNGEIEGSYDSGETYSSNQTAITVNMSSDAFIKNLRIHHIPGRGITDALASQYGELVTVHSAESYSNGQHTTAKIDIKAGYKYLRTVGGYGYNSSYVVEPVRYRFYNDEDTIISTVDEIPSYPVEIPSNAVTFDLVLQTGKSGLTDGFVPFNVGFTNYNSFERIEDCEIRDCKDWGIANLFCNARLLNVNILQPFNKGFDVEDHQASKITCENCNITGNMYVNSFYACYINCRIDRYAPYFGQIHSFYNCFGALNTAPNRDFYKTPLLFVSGGQMSITSGTYTSEDVAIKNGLKLCSGSILLGRATNTMNVFGPNFTFRNQSIVKAEAAFVGTIIGKYINRHTNNMPMLFMKTYPGSNFMLFADVETLNGQLSSYIQSTVGGDCYGLHGINCVIYPNGFTIYDSTFAPDGGNVGKTSPNYMNGKYVRCMFDAKKSNAVAANSSNGFELAFDNCSFKNLTSNRLLLERASRSSTVTLTFNNCTFEDAPISSKDDVLQYICSNLSGVVIVIDGTSYTE